MAAFDSATASQSPTAAQSPRGGDGGEESGDNSELMRWMHANGFPRDAKVTLREKPAVSDGEKSIHYVAAKEDLQVRSSLAPLTAGEGRRKNEMENGKSES